MYRITTGEASSRLGSSGCHSSPIQTNGSFAAVGCRFQLRGSGAHGRAAAPVRSAHSVSLASVRVECKIHSTQGNLSARAKCGR
jgi:hypothetical protein